jgi:hypothetical protein
VLLNGSILEGPRDRLRLRKVKTEALEIQEFVTMDFLAGGLRFFL